MRSKDQICVIIACVDCIPVASLCFVYISVYVVCAAIVIAIAIVLVLCVVTVICVVAVSVCAISARALPCPLPQRLSLYALSFCWLPWLCSCILALGWSDVLLPVGG